MVSHLHQLKMVTAMQTQGTSRGETQISEFVVDNTFSSMLDYEVSDLHCFNFSPFSML
jgi:hypothetical protein